MTCRSRIIYHIPQLDLFWCLIVCLLIITIVVPHKISRFFFTTTSIAGWIVIMTTNLQKKKMLGTTPEKGRMHILTLHHFLASIEQVCEPHTRSKCIPKCDIRECGTKPGDLGVLQREANSFPFHFFRSIPKSESHFT